MSDDLREKLSLAPFTHCPICGGANACVMESVSPDSACWCQSEEFSAALLDRVPDVAKHKACICLKCAREARGAPKIDSDTNY